MLFILIRLNRNHKVLSFFLTMMQAVPNRLPLFKDPLLDILNISEQSQAGTRVPLDFNITAEINDFINYAWPACICSLSNDTRQQPLEELNTFFKYCREDTVCMVSLKIQSLQLSLTLKLCFK